jgi:hypothetical protein
VSVKNIDRVSAPSPDVFYSDYVLNQRPVIFTDLFDCSPLPNANTLEGAGEMLGDIAIEIRNNYIAEYLGRVAPQPVRTLALREYLKLLQEDAETFDLCVEYPTPEPLLELLKLGSYRQVQSEGDLYSNMFVAGRGNYAHLHYDDDQRDVLLHQVFGEKRVTVIHPRETAKLEPIDSTRLRRTSAILLENASETERADFLDYANAYDAVIGPGETIFIPAMSWHYIEYLSPAMSVAYRLGRNQYNRRLAALFPDPSIDVQALALLLLNPDEASRKHETWLEQLEASCRSPFANHSQRFKALKQQCTAIRATHCAY